MIFWLPNKKDWNCKIYYHLIISNFKSDNYNYECGGEKKNIIYKSTRIIYIVLHKSEQVERVLKSQPVISTN
jgi:hypothetical protein